MSDYYYAAIKQLLRSYKKATSVQDHPLNR